MQLPSEIFWLVLAAGYTMLLVAPYAINRIGRIGLARLLAKPLPGDDPFEQEWAHRAYRAHMNAIENLVVFAPLALAVIATQSANEITALSCAVYFWARVVHAPVYILNIPYLRFFAWVVGMVACFVLIFQLI